MVDLVTPYEALSLAIERLGSQAKLAELCEVSTTAVWKWTQSAKRLPGEYALRVEAATRVDRHWLAPDLYPRGLVDGLPYSAEEPELRFTSITLPPRHERRDLRAGDADARFHGVDRRAGAQL